MNYHMVKINFITPENNTISISTPFNDFQIDSLLTARDIVGGVLSYAIPESYLQDVCSSILDVNRNAYVTGTLEFTGHTFAYASVTCYDIAFDIHVKMPGRDDYMRATLPYSALR